MDGIDAHLLVGGAGGGGYTLRDPKPLFQNPVSVLAESHQWCCREPHKVVFQGII